MAVSEGIMKTKDDCEEDWWGGEGGRAGRKRVERDEWGQEVYSTYKYFRQKCRRCS
jgi:hypothetical protein